MDVVKGPQVEFNRKETAPALSSLAPFFRPKSIAVIGASRQPGTIGNKLFHNLLHEEFKGVVYPVNPNAEYVASVKAYPSVLDVPGDVELAIVIVPAASVNQVAEQCGRKGVRGVCVISAGFAESGPEGVERQARLLDIARRYGMRLIGPNCMGTINTDVKVSLNGTFSGVFPSAGKVAFGTQSGALGLAILEYARSLNIGLSTFASIGNKADVSSNDLLQYWQDDPATDVILLYLESFGNPKKFARIARSVTRSKPVIAVKSGRTPAGSRAAASHTGALATTEVATEALLGQVGVTRVDTLEELFDVANLFSHQPIPRGRRTAILTNGGGPGIMTADACAAHGLEVVNLSGTTLSGLKAFLRPEASLVNPIDMTAEATAEDYGRSLRVLAQDDSIDIVIVIFIPPVIVEYQAVADAIRQVSPEFNRRGKTLVASFMGSRGVTAELGSNTECCVPSFAFPESTVLALAKACEYNDWLLRPTGVIPALPGIDRDRARGVITGTQTANEGSRLWLNPEAVFALLNAYGVRTVRSKAAKSPEAAAAAADELGYPVALKLLSDTIVHKTEVGGVVLDLRSRQEVEQAYGQISDALAGVGRLGEMQGVVVQQMIASGVEVIVGMTEAPDLGPLMMFGMGGVTAELFKDVVFRIHPLTDVDAAGMVRSVKAYGLLQGWRGSRPADVKSLEDLLLRVSALVEDHPEIVELDLNPVKALEEGQGCMVVDARVLVAGRKGASSGPAGH